VDAAFVSACQDKGRQQITGYVLVLESTPLAMTAAVALARCSNKHEHTQLAWPGPKSAGAS
jgi:hypothetical protein